MTGLLSHQRHPTSLSSDNWLIFYTLANTPTAVKHGRHLGGDDATSRFLSLLRQNWETAKEAHTYICCRITTELHTSRTVRNSLYYWSFSFNSNWKHLPDIIDSLGIKHTRCNTSASGAAALIGPGNFWSLSKYFTFNRIIWSFSN